MCSSIYKNSERDKAFELEYGLEIGKESLGVDGRMGNGNCNGCYLRC